MIFPLVQDFADALAAMPRENPRQRILKLLDEAIRRDVHFIDRHPTTLFQCLWNTCWWYDCPEAWSHGDYPSLDFVVRHLLNSWHALVNWFTHHSESPALFELLARWRTQKQGRTPGFRWLRSLRPPPRALQENRRPLACYTRYVKSVGTSPDGTRIISVGSETWIGVWDGETGRLLARKHMGVRSVSNAAFSPDGNWFGGLSYNDRVTLAWKTKSLWETYVPQDELERVVFNETRCPNRYSVEHDVLGTTIKSDLRAELAVLANVQYLQSDRDGHTWAGFVDNYIGIFRLEGEL